MGYALFFVILLFACLLIPFSGAASEAASEALLLCVGNVVPTLFPFMVCAGYVTKCGLFEKLERLGGKTLFPVSALIAALCGTPSAALLADSFCKSGLIGGRRASVLLAVINLPGPVFILTLTEGFMGMREYALVFACAVYLPALAGSVLLGFITKTVPVRSQKERCGSGRPLLLLSRSIFDGVLNILRVCGTVVFFKVLCSVLERLGVFALFTPEVKGLTVGLAEMTNGLYELSSFPSRICMTLSAFLLSFGGACIFIQSKMLFGDLDARLYFGVKLVMAFLSAALLWFLYPLVTVPGEVMNSLSTDLGAFDPSSAGIRAAVLASGTLISILTLAAVFIYSRLASVKRIK